MLNFIKKTILLLFISLAVFCFFANGVSAANYYWVGGATNSNTSNPDNWDTAAGACADSGDAAVPGTGDNVYFKSNCTNDATVDQDLTVTSFYMNLGYTATVTVDSIDVSVTGADVRIDNGVLNIINGGGFDVGGTYQINIGYSAGSDVTIKVDGSGSNLSNNIAARVRVGNSGTGTLIIQNGATADIGYIYGAYATDSVGYITVDGSGSILNSSIGSPGLGYIGRSGTTTLTISNGGVVNAETNPWQVGGNAGAEGTINITGSGSQLNISNSRIYLGYKGTGTININDGGILNQPDSDLRVGWIVTGVGTLNIDTDYNLDVVTATEISTNLGTANTPPLQPAGLSGTVESHDSIFWDWSDLSGATGYKVYSASNDSLLTTISSATSSWTQSSLEGNSTQSIYVRGTNVYGIGSASNSSSATTDPSGGGMPITWFNPPASPKY